MLSVLRAMCDTPTIDGRFTSLLAGEAWEWAATMKGEVVASNSSNPTFPDTLMIQRCCAAVGRMSSRWVAENKTTGGQSPSAVPTLLATVFRETGPAHPGAQVQES